MPCTRCGQRGAEPPDGITVFAYRNLFGPTINRRLCARCFAIRGWQTGRYLIAAIGTITAVVTALDGQWLAPLAATASAAAWWWFTGA